MLAGRWVGAPADLLRARLPNPDPNTYLAWLLPISTTNDDATDRSSRPAQLFAADVRRGVPIDHRRGEQVSHRPIAIALHNRDHQLMGRITLVSVHGVDDRFDAIGFDWIPFDRSGEPGSIICQRFAAVACAGQCCELGDRSGGLDRNCGFIRYRTRSRREGFPAT